MRHYLLTVEQTRLLRPSELEVVMPYLVRAPIAVDGFPSPPDVYPALPKLPLTLPAEMELRLPDGAMRLMACRFVQQHVQWVDYFFPDGTIKPPFIEVCVLVGVTPEEVPPGTQLWYEADPS